MPWNTRQCPVSCSVAVRAKELKLNPNASTLRGPERQHFLAVATPGAIDEVRKKDGAVFAPADYGNRYATISGYALSAAWSWMVAGEPSPSVIFYNDV